MGSDALAPAGNDGLSQANTVGPSGMGGGSGLSPFWGNHRLCVREKLSSGDGCVRSRGTRYRGDGRGRRRRHFRTALLSAEIAGGLRCIDRGCRYLCFTCDSLNEAQEAFPSEYPVSMMLSRRAMLAAAAVDRRPKVACVLNAWFPNSHADVFMSRLLDGYRLDGVSHAPRVRVASLYVDQFPVNDMAREQAAEYGIPLYSSVAEALRIGGAALAVDGVAVIGEHGDYPKTVRGNFQYPRKKRFDEVTGEFRRAGRVLPLMNDKYFAYEWTDAKAMYDRVKSEKIPFFCGSSLPLTWRRPPLTFARGVRLREVLAVSFSDLEEHGYHAIELMQAMAEKRDGGETGVAEVRCVEGDAVFNDPFWSRDLLTAALRHRVNAVPKNDALPQAIFVRYRDGLKGTILNLNGQTRDYLFAARDAAGQIHSSCFYIQLFVHNHWGFMVRHFEDLVLTKRTPFPPERTLLSNGILLAGLDSRIGGNGWLATPELSVAYEPGE